MSQSEFNLPMIDFSRLNFADKAVFSRLITHEEVIFTEERDGSATSVLRIVTPPSENQLERLVKSTDSKKYRQLRHSEKEETRSVSPGGKPPGRTCELATTSSTFLASDPEKPSAIPCAAAKTFIFSPDVIATAQELRLDCSTLRRKQLPHKEIVRIIDEIYLFWKAVDEQKCSAVVIRYFREKFPGKMMLEQRAGDFLYSASAGKVRKRTEVKLFMNFLTGKWPKSVFEFYLNLLLEVESLTKEKLIISDSYAEFIGDSVTTPLADCYLTQRQVSGVLAAISLRDWKPTRLVHSPDGAVQCLSLVFRLLSQSVI